MQSTAIAFFAPMMELPQKAFVRRADDLPAKDS
jgi:hypothetical protein